jgi:hypothetical protein
MNCGLIWSERTLSLSKLWFESGNRLNARLSTWASETPIPFPALRSQDSQAKEDQGDGGANHLSLAETEAKNGTPLNLCPLAGDVHSHTISAEAERRGNDSHVTNW